LFFIKYRRTYPKYERYETLKEGLEETLEILLQKGVLTAIISNTSSKRLNYFRKKLNLDRFFSVYISRDDTPYRKPHPYPVYCALYKIKKEKNCPIIKENVYIIGDLKSDIECANNAGVKSIALLSGHGKKKDLIALHPTIILEKIQDLLKIDLFKKLLLD
jgi:HAD superfamily hydrolase (TIGR01549 family)